MSNPYDVGDKVLVSSGMSKKLVGLTGEVMYIDGEFCEVALEDRKDYDRLHYLALTELYEYTKISGVIYTTCDSCGVQTKFVDLTDDHYCPECDLKRGAETLKEQFTKGCRTEEKAILPEDAQARKEIPLYSGLMQYFPRALCAVAHQSYLGNQQHHPDKPLHWDRSKSSDEEDALLRHMVDKEWVQVAWRALARLEKELEK
jgi:rubredoxin